MTMGPEAFARGVVLDTGPLLLHSFSFFEKGRLLPNVRGAIPIDQVPAALGALTRVFRIGRHLVTTPHVLAEFEAVARQRGQMDDKRFRGLLRTYQPFLDRLRETSVSIREITAVKGSMSSRHLCFTDTALLLAARGEGLPLLTMDVYLRRFARRVGVQAFQLPWDFA